MYWLMIIWVKFVVRDFFYFARFVRLVCQLAKNVKFLLILLHLNFLADTSHTGEWLHHLAKDLGNEFGFLFRFLS